jgi:prepilin-type N-terminal cleavage/methylation domain-containing protein
MCGANKPAFTLVEILVTIALIGAMATILLPILRKRPGAERKTAIANLNSLSVLARNQAIATGKNQKIVFDLKDHTVHLEQETDEKNSSGVPVYKRSRQAYIQNSFDWPAHLQIKQFLVEGSDMMTKFSGADTQQMWFFVAPSGLGQEITLNFIDVKNKRANAPRQIGLVLNPFTVQFKEYDAFQK